MVPTRDGGERFAACVEALAGQDPAPEAVVVIDSGSEDGSPDLARQAGFDVTSITPQTFDHGVTRNQAAAALPPVDAVVFLVQDAVPQSADCLARVAAAALEPGVGAATARQVPPADAGLLTASTVSASPFADDESTITGPFTSLELMGLAPHEWRELLVLDDVCCAIRGELFRRVGFRPAAHGEDVLMAFDLLFAGWAVVHEADAVVEHGHVYDSQTVRERYRADARFFRERFGFRVRPSRFSALKGFAAELRRDLACIRAAEEKEPGVLRRAVALRWAQVWAQRRGSRGPLGSLPERRDVPRPEDLGATTEGAAEGATENAAQEGHGDGEGAA